MHLSLRAGPRRRARRAVLAAALAAVALPAAADAAIVDFADNSNGGAVFYSGHPNEVNNVRVSFTAAGIVVDDHVPIQTLASECRITSAADAICPGGAASIHVNGRDRNDTITYTAPHRGFVIGGSGADTILGGLRQAGFGRAIEPVVYQGKERSDDLTVDTVSYRLASSRVDVRLDGVGSALTFDDGRPGDLEGIFTDVEVIEGSNFNDSLLGSDRNETFRGLNGTDVIGAGGGSDLIDEGSAPNGADTLNGGNGAGDRITYGTRTSGVSVSLDGVRNDGALGEQDDVRPSVEHITGTNFADALVGSSVANKIDGLGGIDSIEGRTGNDTLSGGSGPDTILGQENDDVIFAQDGFEDVVGCGSGIDTAQLDRRDAFGGCESPTVSLAGQTLTAEVQATDTRGRRQLGPDAGTILVAR